MRHACEHTTEQPAVAQAVVDVQESIQTTRLSPKKVPRYAERSMLVSVAISAPPRRLKHVLQAAAPKPPECLKDVPQYAAPKPPWCSGRAPRRRP
eukprot:365490-Chlamydomonas_euryale.AAC.11